jgi:TetR/AcrR family transcriptional regulator, regulator of cefoperazone and chloramphenicol sensitivity
VLPVASRSDSALPAGTCIVLNMCSVTVPSSGHDAIIQKALRLFGERGIDATSLREVAKVAEVSPALVVHHFGGKEGLVAAVDEATLREFGAAYSSDDPAEGSDLLRQRAEQTTRVMREAGPRSTRSPRRAPCARTPTGSG